MNRFFGLTLILAFLAMFTNAKPMPDHKVPAIVKAAFAKLHRATKVKWQVEGKNFEASFNAAGKETAEVYASNGALLETEVAIKTSALPAAVMVKLKGMKIVEAAKITKADGTITYEAEVKGKDFLFDLNGNPVKP